MRTYCVQFRELVLEDIRAGMTKAETARKWKINVGNLRSWLKKEAETGTLEPSKAPRGPKCKLNPLYDLIRKMVQKQPDIRIREIQEQLPIQASFATISRALKAIGFTYKKSNGVRSRTEAAERPSKSASQRKAR